MSTKSDGETTVILSSVGGTCDKGTGTPLQLKAVKSKGTEQASIGGPRFQVCTLRYAVKPPKAKCGYGQGLMKALDHNQAGLHGDPRVRILTLEICLHTTHSAMERSSG